MIVPELLSVSVPVLLVMASEEGPAVSPTTKMPALVIASLPFAKANVVAPEVAIRPVNVLLTRSLPPEKLLVPEVCQESALVLLKVEADASERSTRPLMRPALLMVTG